MKKMPQKTKVKTGAHPKNPGYFYKILQPFFNFMDADSRSRGAGGRRALST